jgi:hypothetical protein
MFERPVKSQRFILEDEEVSVINENAYQKVHLIPQSSETTGEKFYRFIGAHDNPHEDQDLSSINYSAAD